MKRIPQLLRLAGIVLVVVSLFWWYQTFGLKLDYAKCLIVNDGICKVGTLGSLFGGNPYNPIALWVALVCLVVGLGLPKLGKF